MYIDILGSKWEISYRKHDEDPALSDERVGYADYTVRKIVIRADCDGASFGVLPDKFIQKVTRHEIVHAFLIESGLMECSNPVSAWADNEEMVDWFAWQGQKIYKAWEEAGCLECTIKVTHERVE